MNTNMLAVSFTPAQLAVSIIVAVLLAALKVMNVLFIIYMKRNVERRLTGELQEEREMLIKQLDGMKSGEIVSEPETPAPLAPRKLHDERLQQEREKLLEKMDTMKANAQAVRKAQEDEALENVII